MHKSRYVGWMIVVFAVGVLGAAAPAQAQEADAAEMEGSVGLGLDVGLGAGSMQPVIGTGLGGLAFGGGGVPASPGLRIPVQISENWQLEPRITGSYTEEQFDPGSNTGMSGGGEATTTWSVAGSVLVRRDWEITEETVGFTGGRVGLGYASRSVDQPDGSGGGLGGTEGTTLTYSAGPVVGAEHFFSPAFSLGLEATVALEGREWEPSEGDASRTTLGLAPGGSVVVRAYF